MSAKDDLLKGKKILIVDDEPDVLDTLQELLDMCNVVKAGTFEEAKRQLEGGLLMQIMPTPRNEGVLGFWRAHSRITTWLARHRYPRSVTV